MTGNRAGSRRAAKPPRTSRLPAFGYALGITVLVVAWGYLVYVAVDSGSSARAGQSFGWWLLGLASLGAVACLFIGLLLVTRLVRVLVPTASDDVEPAPPRTPGGRRAAR